MHGCGCTYVILAQGEMKDNAGSLLNGMKGLPC